MNGLSGETKSLGEALPLEMARVRDEVLPAYVETGAAGAFAVAMMRHDLNEAAKALASQDVVKILSVYKKLTLWNT
jgi:hypothetical protein